MMSALPPKADIPRGEQYVRFVPIADFFFDCFVGGVIRLLLPQAEVLD